MADTKHNWYPLAAIDPNEPGIAAAYTFPPTELARYGYPKNRHALYGTAYDLATRVGAVKVANGYGVRVDDDAGAYYRGATVTQGIGLVGDVMYDAAPAAARIAVTNGGEHQIRIDAAGTISITLDNGGTYTTTGYSLAGRGRNYVTADHDGTNQRVWINGRVAAQNAVALSVPAGGNLDLGLHGSWRRLVIPSAWTTPVRTRYLREFARNVIVIWKPQDVGTGPSGGIVAGRTGRGTWVCPLGGATMSFVWVNDLSYPAGGYLALTDTGALSLRRISLMAMNRPAFGSWLWEFTIRDPAADNPYFALAPLPDTDPTAASSNAYWVSSRIVAGVWNTDLYLANGASIVNVTGGVPVAGSKMKVLLTRHTNGDWRLGHSINGVWYWQDVAGNNVTVLSENWIQTAPRGSYITGYTHWLGEMSPAELEIV